MPYITPCIVIEGQMYVLNEDGDLWNVNAVATPGTYRRDYSNPYSNDGTSDAAEVIDWRWRVDKYDSYPQHHARATRYLNSFD